MPGIVWDPRNASSLALIAKIAGRSGLQISCSCLNRWCGLKRESGAALSLSQCEFRSCPAAVIGNERCDRIASFAGGDSSVVSKLLIDEPTSLAGAKAIEAVARRRVPFVVFAYREPIASWNEKRVETFAPAVVSKASRTRYLRSTTRSARHGPRARHCILDPFLVGVAR